MLRSVGIVAESGGSWPFSGFSLDLLLFLFCIFSSGCGPHTLDINSSHHDYDAKFLSQSGLSHLPSGCPDLTVDSLIHSFILSACLSLPTLPSPHGS